MNEALILTALEAGDVLSVAGVAARLEGADIGRSIDDGSIYLALHRMTQRGLVTSERRTVTSADGKQREIGFYSIGNDGRSAIAQFLREANAATRLSAGTA
jgi:DNA-binding PadR family transcriptional regulator